MFLTIVDMVNTLEFKIGEPHELNAIKQRQFLFVIVFLEASGVLASLASARSNGGCNLARENVKTVIFATTSANK